jgi:hypothetical protein
MSRFLTRQLSRLWPVFVFAGLMIALSVAKAEDGNDANNNVVYPEGAAAAEGAQPGNVQPAAAQQVDQTRMPAEAPATPPEQEQNPAPAPPADANNQ